MQLESKNNQGSFRNSRLILFSIIVFILIVFLFLVQARWIIFVIFFLVVVIFSTLLFWLQYAVPELGIAEQLILAKKILFNQFTNSSLILTIINGKIEGDYLLLKNKPEIHYLNIDHKSAVLVENTSNQRLLYLNGIHRFNKKLKILGVFDIGFRYLQIGPCERSEIGPRQAKESIADFHLRKKKVEKTKTRLSSGDLIYPSFSIFYRLDSSGQEKMDNVLFRSVYKKFGDHSTELLSSEMIDEFIVSQIVKLWSKYCENKELDEIFIKFPASFDLPWSTEFGIKTKITLDQVFLFDQLKMSEAEK
jgi:hypothetical protein